MKQVRQILPTNRPLARPPTLAEQSHWLRHSRKWLAGGEGFDGTDGTLWRAGTSPAHRHTGSFGAKCEVCVVSTVTVVSRNEAANRFEGLAPHAKFGDQNNGCGTFSL